MEATKAKTVTRKLKSNHLLKFLKEKRQIQLSYDSRFDALVLFFDSKEKESIVHHIDEYVGLLYDPRTKEIVGIQIECFKENFLPKHDEIQRVWKCSEPDQIKDLGDMIIVIEQVKPKIAHAVFQASRDLLQNQGLRVNQLISNTAVASMMSP